MVEKEVANNFVVECASSFDESIFDVTYVSAESIFHNVKCYPHARGRTPYPVSPRQTDLRVVFAVMERGFACYEEDVGAYFDLEFTDSHADNKDEVK